MATTRSARHARQIVRASHRGPAGNAHLHIEFVITDLTPEPADPALTPR